MHGEVFYNPTWIPDARLRVKLYKNMPQGLQPRADAQGRPKVELSRSTDYGVGMQPTSLRVYHNIDLHMSFKADSVEDSC